MSSIVLHGISWSTYEALLAELEESHQHLWLTYDERDLEITSPSYEHEHLKKLIGRLINTLTWVREELSDHERK